MNIIINLQLDSIYTCFEKINDLSDYYSYDSLKIRISDILFTEKDNKFLGKKFV